ncbi:MAG: signal peptidase I [Planctomycetota bacterium]|nr:signal peptidase I [Planctomycetota bacterium]
MADPARDAQADTSIKETFVSLLISFVMALVFRSYVVEAFIIPTGSMAPTLLGAHMRFESPQTGNSWAVNPWYPMQSDMPSAIQGDGEFWPPSATDPLTTSQINPMRPGGRPPGVAGYVTPPQPKPLLAGDRILVQKYLYNIFPPERWDVVVFKNPELATQNFIKRLVGLPGEQIWIADGDLFTRPAVRGPLGTPEPTGPWKIARKPPHVQESVWRTVFSSELTPIFPVRDGRRWFSPPWRGEGWVIEDQRDYRFAGSEPTTLTWDVDAWPINDWVPYNEIPSRFRSSAGIQPFPLCDVRMRVGVRPDTDGMTVRATIAAHEHEFQLVWAAGNATLRMRPIAPASGAGAPWTDLATAPLASPATGRVTNIAFAHFDQTLELTVERKVVLRATYDWGPSERLLYATGKAGDEYVETSPAGNALRYPDTYRNSRPSISWDFAGSPVTVYRAGLDKDLYYEAAQFHTSMNGMPAFGTHPANLVTLGPDQYFMLGDNSPASKDGRLWEVVDPFVAEQIDATVGVVPRKLILGKAFFVYFPAPAGSVGPIPVPDFGRMRLIR